MAGSGCQGAASRGARVLVRRGAGGSRWRRGRGRRRGEPRRRPSLRARAPWPLRWRWRPPTRSGLFSSGRSSILARRGGDHFCGLGEPGSCAAVWDLPLASAIQGGTGLPVAGWGLVWSAVAFVLPLWALVRRARGHALEPIWSAALLTVLAGIGSVVVLAGASFAASVFCTTCVITYVLVLAYAAVCLRASDQTPTRGASTRRADGRVRHPGCVPGPALPGAAYAAKLGGGGIGLPRGGEERHRGRRDARQRRHRGEAPAEANRAPSRWKKRPSRRTRAPSRWKKRPSEGGGRSARGKSSIAVEEAPVEVEKSSIEVEEKPIQVAKRSIEAEEEPAEIEQRPDAAKLEELIARLSPELRQGLSDALAAYSRRERVPLRPARLLIGPSNGAGAHHRVHRHPLQPLRHSPRNHHRAARDAPQRILCARAAPVSAGFGLQPGGPDEFGRTACAAWRRGR